MYTKRGEKKDMLLTFLNVKAGAQLYTCDSERESFLLLYGFTQYLK